MLSTSLQVYPNPKRIILSEVFSLPNMNLDGRYSAFIIWERQWES